MTDREAIERMKLLAKGGTNFSEGSNEACKIALEALQEREERQWISVKDRLPEVGQAVLTYGRKGSIGIGFIQQNSCSNGKVYFYPRYGDSLPTHWMPRPEPPKEEEKV